MRSGAAEKHLVTVWQVVDRAPRGAEKMVDRGMMRKLKIARKTKKSFIFRVIFDSKFVARRGEGVVCGGRGHCSYLLD